MVLGYGGDLRGGQAGMAKVEITDRKSAEAWLEGQPHQVQIWFATRCALRALPALQREPDEKFDHLAFASFRAILISAAAATCPATKIIQLRSAAHSAADSAYSAAAASAAASAAYSAVYSAAVPAASTFNAVDSADSAAYATFATVYAAASSDGNAGTNEKWTPLWPAEKMPENLSDLWSELKITMQATPEKWAFWLEWYEALLRGDWQNWDLILRIAKEVTEDQWDAGPERVAERIKEIEDQYWADKLPQHEILEADPISGKYTVKAQPFEPADAVERWLVQIEFATSLAIDSNSNDFNRMSTAFKFIDHSLTNCRDDPNAIEQNLGVAHGILAGNLSDPDFHKDDAVKALAQVVGQIQIQMRADHPDVRKAWEKRIAQKLRETDRETKLLAAKAIRSETARTDGRLTTEMELDAEAVASSGSEDAAATSLRRAGGRSAKMNALDRTGKVIKGIDDSASYKATRIGATGWTIVEIIQKLFGL